MPDEPKRPGLARNLISQAGVAIAVIAVANLAFLIYMDATQRHGNPYLGILTWIVAPAILIFGLAVYIGGMLIERARRRKRGIEELPEYPRIDLNERRTRMIALFAALGIMVFVTMTVIGSYQAYHYTDSDAFCGTLCHQVMHPE
ncbi:MAG TPA: cytochrome C, partial [Thermoanaerobaculia bacterium]